MAANFTSVHGAILRKIHQEYVAKCAATLPSLEPSTEDTEAVVKHKHIHVSTRDSSAGEQPPSGGADERKMEKLEEQQRRSTGGKKRKMAELEEEAIMQKLKADYINLLKKKIKFLEEQIVRHRATVEVEDIPTIEDIIRRRLNSGA